MTHSFFLFVVLALQGTVTAQITTCPVTETTQTTSDGKKYQVCSSSDYQGPSTEVIGSVASVAACTQLCNQRSACTRAVYDNIYKYCHIKGSPLTWTTSNQFTAIRLADTIAQGTVITQCPYTETTQTTSGGSTFQVCPGTDYQGSSYQMIQNVASTAACTQLCDNSADCSRAVYDLNGKVCHLKGQQLTWVVDRRFDSARITKKNSAGQLNACPTTETTQNIGPATYQICSGTDYVGPSAQIIPNVANNVACTQLCDGSYTCVRAVFDKNNKVCHIKGDTAQLSWRANAQFDTIRIERKLDPANVGKWSNLINFPVIPVAGYVVPEVPQSSRMLVWSAYGTNNFGGAQGFTQFADYNFRTGAVSQRTISNTQHDMFCPGISSLADGRIVITGGSDAQVTSIYDPAKNAFIRGPDMKISRGYQTSVTLSNGRVFTIGGSYSGGMGGKNGEIYNPSTNTWTLLPGADVSQMLTDDHEGIWREDNHAWLFAWRNGAVFQAGPSRNMHWYGTSGSGSVQDAGTRDTGDAMCGVNVMYDTGKIFSAGGGQDYTNTPATSRAHLIGIDQVNQPATVERLPDMKNARAFANTVVLPDGTVLISGGQRYARVFTDSDAVLSPELFNPATKTFKELAPEIYARNYHAISLLLPDGTVFSGGGGLCYAPRGQSDAGCNRAVDHPNGQIFSPPYLFRADGSLATRPVISGLSSTTSSQGASVRVGGTLTVTMSDNSAGVTFSLIRIGSATHSINSDQRRISMTSVRQNGARYTITVPSDSGILPPGYYYVFAISSSGVPSIARTIQVAL